MTYQRRLEAAQESKRRPAIRQAYISRTLVIVFVGLFLPMWGCGDDPPENSVILCSDTRDCPGGQFCGCGGVCVTPSRCETSDDCCVNELCQDGLCLALNNCESDDECAGTLACQGCACLPRGCSGDGDCAEGLRCDGGLCLDATSIPCDAACGDNEVCEPVRNRCEPAPDGCQTLTCSPGETMILSGLHEHLGPMCTAEQYCACAAPRQPPEGQIGTDFSAIALTPTRFGVLAHDHFYGDLAYFEVENGELLFEPIYLDGVPEEPPRADPNGIRGGVYGAGPDRGDMPAAATDGTIVGVAYRDRDAAALRFARQFEGGQWQSILVDDQGDAGHFPDLIVMPDGRWVIAYYARAGERSELRVAVSLSNTPYDSSEWTHLTVDAGPSEATSSGAVVDGVGLYPSLIHFNGELRVVYYNGEEGDLRIAAGPVTGPLSVSILDEGGTTSEIEGAADTGLYTAIASNGAGTVGVAFLDRVSGRLQYIELDSTATAAESIEEIDPGLRSFPPRRLGSEIFLTFNDGLPVVGYQDATNGDFFVGLRTVDGWRRGPVARTGAAGFSPHLFFVSDGVWLLHGRLIVDEDDDLTEDFEATLIPPL